MKEGERKREGESDKNEREGEREGGGEREREREQAVPSTTVSRHGIIRSSRERLMSCTKQRVPRGPASPQAGP